MNDRVVPTMFVEIPVDIPLKVILNALPPSQDRNEELQRAYRILFEFVGQSTSTRDTPGGFGDWEMAVRIIEKIKHHMKAWLEASTSVKPLLEVFRCYRKTVQVLGRIFQG